MNKEELSNEELFSRLLTVIETQAQKTFQDITKEIKDENKKLLEKLERQVTEINNLKQANQEIEERCVHLERSLRKNNILVFGLPATPDNTEIFDFASSRIEELLGVTVHRSEINNIYRLNSAKGTPIKIEFVSYLNKTHILKNCHKLKNSKIFIAHDLCFEDRQNLKILQEHLKQARAKNHTAVIRGNFLVVDGKRINVHDLTENSLHSENDLTANGEKKDEQNPVVDGSPKQHLVKRTKTYTSSNSLNGKISGPITRATSKFAANT